MRGQLTALQDTLFFIARDSAHGLEIWKSDGTAAGTLLLKDIRPDAQSATKTDFLAGFTNFNGAVYFRANDGVHGLELWKTDGTMEGTTLVSGLLPGTAGSRLFQLVATDDKLFSSAMA